MYWWYESNNSQVISTLVHSPGPRISGGEALQEGTYAGGMLHTLDVGSNLVKGLPVELIIHSQGIFTYKVH